MRVAIAVLVMFAVLNSWVFAQTAVPPAGGDGLTTRTAYQISELGNLVWLQQEAAAKRTPGKYYVLKKDIDASDTARWNDPGTTTSTLEGFIPIRPFDGVFEGGGHTISGLKIDRDCTTTLDLHGLFGRIGSKARVSNLNMVGFSVRGDQSGCLAGTNAGTVTNCHAGGIVQGANVGGLICTNTNGTIQGCTADCITTTGKLRGGSVGGLVGISSGGTLLNCSSSGSVTSEHSFGGGLIGRSSYDRVSGCHATGAVRGNYAGGLIAITDGSAISKSFATGNVAGYWATGGLMGDDDHSTVSLCYATGDVTGSFFAGGLAGSSVEDYIENCYAIGSVIRMPNPINMRGGLIASAQGSKLKNCYASGFIGTSFQFSGGLIGWASSITVTNSYWNHETAETAVSNGGTSKTTEQMRTQATFENWGFKKTWGIQNNYPYLRALPTLTVTYAAGMHGSVTEGGSNQFEITRRLNVGANTMLVTAVPDLGYEFAGWSDGIKDAVRMDRHVMAALAVTANFRSTLNAAREWFLYQ